MKRSEKGSLDVQKHLITEEGELKKSIKANKRVIKREESLAVLIKKFEGLGKTQCARETE